MYASWSDSYNRYLCQVLSESIRWIERVRIESSKSIYAQGHILNEEKELQLLEPFTGTEIKKVIWGMNVNKSPGPDGYGSGFLELHGIL